LHRDIGYVPPTDTGSLCLAVDSTRTVVGLFRSLLRRSGTHCQMNSEIRRVMLTASNSSLKQSCSALTSVTGALEVIFNVMRSINPRFTYLLTYSRSHMTARQDTELYSPLPLLCFSRRNFSKLVFRKPRVEMSFEVRWNL